jgi:hypothetical protein
MKHSITRLIAICCVGCTIALSATSNAQHIRYNLTWPGPTVDSIDAGVSFSGQLQGINYSGLFLQPGDAWIHNPTDETIYYTCTYGFGGGGYLYFDSAIGMTIAPHDSVVMHLLFLTSINVNAEGILDQIWYMNMNSLDDTTHHWNCEFHMKVRVEMPIDSSDIRMPLFKDQMVYQSLMLMDLNNYTMTVPVDSTIYYNNQDSTVTIQYLFVPTGSHFSIANYSDLTFPITLHKNESLPISFLYSSTPDTVGFIGPDPMDSTKIDTSYNDIVVIITDTTFQIAKANYKGYPPKITQSSAIARHEAVPSQIVLTANPLVRTTEIRLANASIAKFTIVDLMGNIVARHDGNNWRWDGISSSGLKLPNGAYSIEAVGINSSGKSIHDSRAFILMK